MKKYLSILLAVMMLAFTIPAFAGDINATATMQTGAGLVANSDSEHKAYLSQVYDVECIGADGEVKWVDGFKNLVPTVGLNYYLDCALSTAGCNAPDIFGFLVTGPGSGTTFDAADTMAVNDGWNEDTTYSEGTRPQWVPNGAASGGSVSNSSSKMQFSINGSATIAGAGVCTDSTKSGILGTLVGAGDFTGGDRAVVSGDTLNVTVSFSISAS